MTNALRFLTILFSLTTSAVLGQTGLDHSVELDGVGNWRLSWLTDPGEDYTLQRSRDLVTWENVDTITAEGDAVVYLEPDDGSRLLMWRIIGPSGETNETIKISDIQPSNTSRTTADGTSLGITIDAGVPVRSVVYFNGESVLGNASRSEGNLWSLDLDWERSRPRVAQLSVEVTTTDGMSVRTPTSGVLIADPNQFVALGRSPRIARQVTDGLAAELEAFISADADGDLEPFLFFPEGQGDPAETTGAHFAFARGAQVIESENGFHIEFQGAHFCRSATDTQPVPSRLGDHRIDIDRVTSGAVASAFQFRSGDPVTLLWGPTALAWVDGTLNPAGWEGLTVVPVLGDFVLPPSHTRTVVNRDPESGTAFLTTSFHGEWIPVPGKPARFQVSPGNSLQVAISQEGALQVSGAVAAVFPDGSTVRGAISWRYPNFEIRIEGQTVTLPILGALTEVVPIDSSVCVDENGAETLRCLTAFQNIYRGMALSGQNQALLDETAVFTPAPVPGDTTGALFEAWAWRLRSWNRDRNGQSLTSDQLERLRTAITSAVDMAEGAQDLPTPLKRYHDLLLLKGSEADVGALSLTIEQAERDLLSVIERLISAAPAREIQAESAKLLLKIDALLGDEADARMIFLYGRFVDTYLAVVDPESQQLLLADRSAGEILVFLRDLKLLRELSLKRQASAQRQADLLVVAQAANAAEARFVDAQNLRAEELLFSSDYSRVLALLDERYQFLALTRAEDVFEPSTGEMVDALFALRDLRPLEANQSDCVTVGSLLSFLHQLRGDDALAFHLHQVRGEIVACNSDPLGEATLDRIRALAVEARLQVQLGEAENTPRLFLNHPLEQQSWIALLVARLEAAELGDWATSDHAVSILLAEAKAMQTLGAPGLLQLYLEAAVRVLDTLRLASRAVSDRFQSPTQPSHDWAIPGNIRLSKLGGAARIDVREGAFAGRLSGEMKVRELDGTFVVRNLSFDSDGRVDFSAYGSAAYPVGSPHKVTLTVAQRRPLTFHIAGGELLQIGGHARVSVPGPNGTFNTVEVSVDLNNPRYEFGLAYSGSATVQLAREMVAQLPQVDASAELEDLAAYGGFFGTLGKGLEPLHRDSMELPAIGETTGDGGTAIEAGIAWVLGFLNDNIRPEADAAIQAPLLWLEEIIEGMEREVRSAELAGADRLKHLQALKRQSVLTRRLIRAREFAVAEQIHAVTGDDGNSRFMQELQKLLVGRAAGVESIVTSSIDDRLAYSMDVLRLYSHVVTEAQLAGNAQVTLNLALIDQKLTEGFNRLLADVGVYEDGRVLDEDIFSAASTADLEVVLEVGLAIEAQRVLTGIVPGARFKSAPLSELPLRLFEKLQAGHEEAKVEGNLRLQMVHALRMQDLAAYQALTEFGLEGSDLNDALTALPQIYQLSDTSSIREQVKIAHLFTAEVKRRDEEQRLIARRVTEIIGRDDQRLQPEDIDFPFRYLDDQSDDFIDRWMRTYRVVAESDLPLVDDMRNALTHFMKGFARVQLERYAADGSDVEQNLVEAQGALGTLSSMLAGAKNLLQAPFQTEDEEKLATLHVNVVAASSELQDHAFLANYAQELVRAASRYGEADAQTRADLRSRALDSVTALRSAVVTLGSGVDLNAFEFKLPGELKVKSAFGNLAFDLSEDRWEVNFGGQIAFDDYDLAFGIPNASLTSDGAFDLSLITDGAVTFSGLESSVGLLPNGPQDPADPSLRLDISSGYSLTGNLFAPSIDSATAIGAVSFDPGGNVAVRLDYDYLEDSDSHRLAFASRTVGALPLFTDQIVVFEGALGSAVQLGGEEVLEQGVIELSADTVGIMRKPQGLGKAIEALSPEDFFLIVRNVGVILDYTNFEDRHYVELCLQGGEIQLPSELFPNSANLTNGRPPTANQPPTIIALDGTVCLRWDVEARQLSFRNAEGGPASITWSTPLPLMRFDGMDVRVSAPAGANIAECPPGLSVAFDEATGVPTFTVAGNVDLEFDPTLIEGDLTQAGSSLCLEWTVGEAPRLAIGAVNVAGDFRLGGAKGVAVEGAVLALSGLGNLFDTNTEEPVKAVIGGSALVGGFVGFELQNAAFVWDANSPVPRFVPGDFALEAGDEAITLMEGYLPIYPTKLGLRFVDGERTVAGGLFAPDNIVVLLSGKMALPNAQAIEAGTPGLLGGVTDMRLHFKSDPLSDLTVPDLSRTFGAQSGFCLEVVNLKIPPFEGLTGGLCLGNLQAIDAGRPQDVFFAGQLQGKLNDVGVGVKVALKPTELIGLCFEGNAAGLGIPIDGGVMGGILLTGGRGGINFKNAYSNPCNFAQGLTIDVANNRVIGNIAAKDGSSPPNLMELPYEDAAPPIDLVPDTSGAVPSQPEFDCLIGDFPPPTLNPLCERLPNGRVIFQGTSLSRAQVDTLLREINLPGDTAEALSPSEVIERVVGQLVNRLKADLNIFLVRIPQGGDAQAFRFLQGRLQALLDSAHDLATNALSEGFRVALDADPNQSSYEILVAKLAEGIPCFDVTVSAQGLFTHATAPGIVTAEGGITLSTTGTAAIEGQMKLAGIPIADGIFAFSATDDANPPNLDPSFGGVAKVALGPLEFGNMQMSLGCPGCYGSVVDLFDVWLDQQLRTGSAEVRAFLRDVMGDGIDLSNLSEGELFNFFSGLVAEVQTRVVYDDVSLSMTSFLTEFLFLLAQIATEVNLRVCFAGEVQPTLFGFPLAGAGIGGGVLFHKYTDPSTNEAYQELVAQTKFSPTQLLLAPILQANAFAVPSIDQVNLGYSLRMEAFEADDLEGALADPLGYGVQQVKTLAEDGVLSFGFQLEPMGFTLADGQGRMIMPRFDGHPLSSRRKGAWVNPDSLSELPGRAEMILAMLDAGQIQNPLFRGTGLELEGLFGDPTLRKVDLAYDYFPHGGFIGGAEIALPNVLTKAPPYAQLALLLSVPGTPDEFQEWLSNAGVLFADPNEPSEKDDPGYAYFRCTTPQGQMALYMPAPNPAVDFDRLAEGSAEFFESFDFGSFEGIVPPTAFAYDQVLLSGWLETSILGLPLQRGDLIFNPSQNRFEITAAVLAEIDGESTWLHDFVGASAEFRMTAPAYMLGEESPAEQAPVAVLEEIGNDILSGAITDAGRVAEYVARIEQVLPKVSMEMAATLNLEPFADFLRRSGKAEAQFFAFSPAFDPSFDPTDDSPYAVAQRRGGMGVRSSFQVGYFPEFLNEEQHILIEVDDASLALFPDADFAVLPAMAGQLRGKIQNLPLGLNFTTAGNGEALVQFNSSPAVGEDHLQVDGELAPIDLGPFLQVTPLEGEQLSAAIRVTRTETDPTISVGILPAEARIPMLGTDLVGRIFGGSLDHETLDTGNVRGVAATLDERQPFTYSSVEGQPWSAVVRLDGRLEIRSPLDNDGPVLFSAEAATQNDVVVPFLAQIDGVGAKEFELRLTIPNGLTFTLFPEDAALRSTFTVGSNSAACLFVDQDGRIYFDSGTQELDLAAGLGSVKGRIELGYEPFLRLPRMEHSLPSEFTAGLGSSVTQTVTVTNTRTGTSQLIVDASMTESTHFTVFPSRLIIGGGQSADLIVRFHPKSADVSAPSLILETNVSNNPRVEVPLTASVTTQPKIHVDTMRIDFGETPLGQSKSQMVRVTNLGDASLSVVGTSTTGAAFTDDQAGFSVAPLDSALITVSFEPSTKDGFEGGLRLSSNDPARPVLNVSLSGSGSDRFWYRQRKGRGQDGLSTIAMRPEKGGNAFGGFGNLLVTGVSYGRHWGRSTLVGNPYIHASVALSDDDLVVAGEGYAGRSTDGGLSWTELEDANLKRVKVSWKSVAVIGQTGRVAFAGGDSNGSIVIEASPGKFETAVINGDKVPVLNAITFGTSITGIAVGEGSTILRTSDGGKTWNGVSGLPAATKGLAMLGVAGDPFDASTYVMTGEQGLILRSTNGGVDWTVVPTDVAVDLHDVVRGGDKAFYAVGDRGTVMRSNDRATAWVREDLQAEEDFHAVTVQNPDSTAVGKEVWAVTRQGSIHHRLSSPISSAIVVAETEAMNSLGAAAGERLFRDVRLSNQGSARSSVNLGIVGGIGAANVSAVGGTRVTLSPGEDFVYPVLFDAQRDGRASGRIVVTANGTDAKLGKESINFGIDVKEPRRDSGGYVRLPGQIDLGVIPVGERRRATIAIDSLGDEAVALHLIDVRHDFDTATYTTTLLGESVIEPDKSVDAVIEFVATEAGDYRAVLEVASDAGNGLAYAEVVARAVAPPTVVVVGTSPPGLNFLLDHNADGIPTVYSNTSAFTVVDDLPSSIRQIQRGRTINVIALESIEAQGQHWEFQRWLPGGPREMSFIAGQHAGRFTAKYAVGPQRGSDVEEVPTLVASPCLFEVPNDVPQGPWVRITEAQLTLAWPEEFRAYGDLFLSLEHSHGSLISSRARFHAPDGRELLETTPGSWNFDIDSDRRCRFTARTPGVQVLDAASFPPSELAIDMALRAQPRRASLTFETRDELPLAPGVLAFSPATVNVTADVGTNNANVSLEIRDGSLLALADPRNQGEWLIERPYAFSIGAAVAPLDFDQRTELANLGIVRLFADKGSEILPVFGESSIGLEVRRLDVELFRTAMFTVDGAIDTTGKATFTADLNQGLNLGPAELVPRFANDGEFHVVSDPTEGRLSMELPAMSINSATALWPDDSFRTTRQVFDTGSFRVRLPLPEAIDFAGFAMRSSSAQDADHYFELLQTPNQSAAKLRNRMELGIGNLKFAFDVDNAGTLSGSLSGQVGFGPVSARASMSYDSKADPEFSTEQFGVKVEVGGGDPIAVKVSAGAE